MSAPASNLPRTDAPAELTNPGLVLLWGNSPNGWKITHYLQALKEAGCIPDYTAVEVFLQNNEQFEPWFRKINPNSKMPALIDNREGKKPLHIWESASILLYLSKTYDTKGLYWFAEDDDLQTEMLNWIFFFQGGVGPMQGNANHFFRYSGERIPYATDRFINETKRLYQVLDDHLSGKDDGIKKDWLVGDKYTLAEMTGQPWIRCHFWCGISLDPYPSLAAWVARVDAIPSVQAALKVPQQDLVTRIKSNPDLERQIMQAMRQRQEEDAEEKKKKGEGEAQR
ncbi:hypothetical protein JCM10207_007531 [Rhodosporidiobolus poonsookiae]